MNEAAGKASEATGWRPLAGIAAALLSLAVRSILVGD